MSVANRSWKGMRDFAKKAMPNFSLFKIILESRKDTVAGDNQEVIGRLKVHWSEERNVDRGR